jgi:hypothetical protein
VVADHDAAELLAEAVRELMNEPVPLPVWLGAASLFASTVGATLTWVHALRSARRSEDIPTARIRSAAQGYVQFFGQSRPGKRGLLRAPLSGARCVWWSYAVTARAGDETVFRQDASRQPFYIEDGTGRCLVDPLEAQLTPSQVKNWVSANAPAPQNELKFFTTSMANAIYECTESVLLPGVRLYVQGHFKTFRKTPQPLDRMHEKLRRWLSDAKWKPLLDVNRDGHIDDRELSAARRAALMAARREVATEVSYEDIVVKPPDGRPFVIAPRIKRAYVQGQFWLALAALAWAAASASALVWLLNSL